MKLDLEINRELVISTSHVTEATFDWLTGENPQGYEKFELPAGDKVEYGVLVLTLFCPSAEFLPPELPALLELARSNACKWLRLDCDGPAVPGFPTFDW